jgi:hypothetical protein
MSYLTLFVVLVLTLFLGCSPTEPETQKEPQEKQEVAPQAEIPKAPSTKLYGEALPKDLPALDLSAILKNPNEYSGKTGLLSGYVRQACSKKGCWMEISASSDPKAKSCRVKFKDYGFFVPLDAGGSTARLAATAAIKVVSKEYVDHYEAEGGSFADKNPDGTANEIQLLATGVELTR